MSGTLVAPRDVAELSTKFVGGALVRRCGLFAALQPALSPPSIGTALASNPPNQPRQESYGRKQGQRKQSLVDCANLSGCCLPSRVRKGLEHLW